MALAFERNGRRSEWLTVGGVVPLTCGFAVGEWPRVAQFCQGSLLARLIDPLPVSGLAFAEASSDVRTDPRTAEITGTCMCFRVGQRGFHDRGQVIPARLPRHAGRASSLECPAELAAGIRSGSAHLGHQPVQDLAFGGFDATQFAPASFFEISLCADFRLPVHPSSTTKHPTMHQRFREHSSKAARTPSREHFG